MTKQPTGFIIYDGPSLLDGKPIIVASLLRSSNGKTGNVVQTYIIRKDVDPLFASKTGEDFSICGNCPMRGTPTDDPTRKQAKDRPCYVVLGQGPLIVYRSYLKGLYPTVQGHEAIASIGDGNTVRLGTYGDPSAVPSYVWDSLLSGSKIHLGYSHQANTPNADYRPDLCMRSADSLQEAEQAWANGERTFRVIANINQIVKGKEILCPASKEAGQRVKCVDCGLCGGSSVKAKNIAIVAHGAGAKKLLPYYKMIA